MYVCIYIYIYIYICVCVCWPAGGPTAPWPSESPHLGSKQRTYKFITSEENLGRKPRISSLRKQTKAPYKLIRITL